LLTRAYQWLLIMIAGIQIAKMYLSIWSLTIFRKMQILQNQ